MLERLEELCNKLSEMLMDVRNIMTWKPTNGTLTYGQAIGKIRAMNPEICSVTLRAEIATYRGDKPALRYSATVYNEITMKAETFEAGTLEGLLDVVRAKLAPPATLEQAEAEAGFDFHLKEDAADAADAPSDAELAAVPQL